MPHVTNPKPSRTARKKAEFDAKASRRLDEDREKAKVRKRDKTCRFPLCGCKRLKLRLEVSHDFHKGMGSKDGVSIAPLMVLLCDHRHKFGTISRHKGTLRSVYLTPDQYDGPVAWEIDTHALHNAILAKAPLGTHLPGHNWKEVARESKPGRLEPLTADQQEVLDILSEMDL